MTEAEDQANVPSLAPEEGEVLIGSSPMNPVTYGVPIVDASVGQLVDIMNRAIGRGERLSEEEQATLAEFLNSPYDDASAELLEAMINDGFMPASGGTTTVVDEETGETKQVGVETPGEKVSTLLPWQHSSIVDVIRGGTTEGQKLEGWADTYAAEGVTASSGSSNIVGQVGFGPWFRNYVQTNRTVLAQIIRDNTKVSSEAELTNIIANAGGNIKDTDLIIPPRVEVDWGYEVRSQAIDMLDRGIKPIFDGNGELMVNETEEFHPESIDEYNAAIAEIERTLAVDEKRRLWLMDEGFDNEVINGLNFDDTGHVVNSALTELMGGQNFNDLPEEVKADTMGQVYDLYPHLFVDPRSGEVVDLKSLDPNDTVTQVIFTSAINASPGARTLAAGTVAQAQDILRIAVPVTGGQRSYSTAASGVPQWETSPVGYRQVELSRTQYTDMTAGMLSWGNQATGIIEIAEEMGIPWEIGMGLLQDYTHGWQPMSDRAGHMNMVFGQFMQNVQQHDSWVGGAIAYKFGDAVAEQLTTYGTVSADVQPAVQAFISSVFGAAEGLGYIGSRTDIQAQQVLTAPPINVADPAAVKEAARDLWETFMLSEPSEGQLNAFASSIRSAEIEAGKKNNAFYQQVDSRAKGGYYRDFQPGDQMLFPIASKAAAEGYRDTFGAARTGHNHGGTDIGAPEGTSVVAPLSGKIVLARWSNGGGGNGIRLLTDSGLGMVFLHLKDMNVRAGDRVVKGAVIGSVGHTGNAESNHLHFEINDGSFPRASYNPGASGRYNPTSEGFLPGSQVVVDGTTWGEQASSFDLTGELGDKFAQGAYGRDRALPGTVKFIPTAAPAGGEIGEYPQPGGDLFGSAPEIVEGVNYAARAEEWLRADPRYGYLYERKPEDATALEYVTGYKNAAKGITGTFANPGSVEAGMRTNSVTTMFGHILGDDDNLDESPTLRQRLYQLARVLNSGV